MHAAARILPLALVLLAGTSAAAAQQPATLRGRVVAADGAAPAGLRAYLRWRAPGDTALRVDSAAVDSAGTFVIALPAQLPDSVELLVDAADAERRAYHPSLARIAGDEAAREHGFVLAPRRWSIVSGRYAGEVVEISPHRARTAGCARCSAFWARMPGPRSPTRYQGWPAARFPLRVAFDRQNSVPAGASPDSAVFWRAAARVEDALGMDVFRPVPYFRTLPRFEGDDPDDVVLVMINRALTTAGLTTVVGRGGNMEYAALSLERASAVLEPQGEALVAHELMHAIGVGHTCGWRSVVAEAGTCPQMRAPAPTAEDVAYTQLLYRVRELQRGGDFRWGLDAAVAGERAILLHRADLDDTAPAHR
jgi:hypothetical protein